MRQIMYESFDFNCDKRKVEAEINFEVSNRTYQEGGHGLPRPIKWTDKIFNSREEAEDYINSLKGYYIQIAVIYNEYPDAFEKAHNDKDYKAISAKLTNIYHAINDLKHKDYFADFKDEYIICPNCGSKINTKIYNTRWCSVQKNYCPVCRDSMLPQSFKDEIRSLENEADINEKKSKEIYTKIEKTCKPVKKWLVKYEYHI